MRAGAMPAVDLSATDMSALVSYLGRWGRVLQTCPRCIRPSPITPKRRCAPASGAIRQPQQQPLFLLQRGSEVFETHACSACHGAAGAGTARAPALAALVVNLPDTELVALYAIQMGKCVREACLR